MVRRPGGERVMFGVDLSRSEWAALAAIAFLFVRVLCAVALVVWWYVTDAFRVQSPRCFVSLLTSVAVAVMCVSLVSIATDWPFSGFRIVVYIATALGGLVLGFVFDLVVGIRLWRASNWLTSLRVPQYRERLLHGDAEVRLGAAKRLGTLGLYSRPARPELLAVVRGDESADVRTAAALAVLYSIPDPADEDADLARELRLSLADADVRVRTVAAAVQVTFRSSPPAELLPILCGGLKVPDPEVSGIAADALGRIGPEAAPAIPDLRDAAMDAENPNGSAPEALGKIGDAAVPALIELLERGGDTARWGAANALGGMGPAARAALPALRKVAGETEGLAGNAARRSIKLLGGDIS